MILKVLTELLQILTSAINIKVIDSMFITVMGINLTLYFILTQAAGSRTNDSGKKAEF